MYLNAGLLYEELQKSFRVRYSGPSSQTDQLRHPLLYRKGMPTMPGYIYVGNSSVFSEDDAVPTNCCIVCAGELPEKYLRSSAFCIMTEADVELSLLFNRIQMIFETFSQWKNRLESLIQRNCTMQEFLDQCQPFFPGNFLLALDANWRVLATTSELSFVMDSTGHTPTNVLTRFKKDPVYIKMRFHREPFLYRGKYFDHDILMYNVRLENELAGVFSLTEQEQPITDGKWTLFSQLVNMVTQLYRQQFYLRPAAIDPAIVLTKMLSGERVSKTELDRALRNISWNPDDEYAVCFIVVHESDKKIRSISYLCQQLEAVMPYALIIEYNNDIVIVLNRSRDRAKQEKSKHEFHSLLRETLLRAGISRPFHDLMDLNNYFEQAKVALMFGAREKTDVPCFYFSDYILPYMLSNIRGGIDAESLCPAGLLTLRDLDKSHGFSYVRTLDTYFRTGLNASRAARELYINRSTFLARMEKICAALGMTLDDHDTRLYLMLCLKMLNS